MKATLTVLGSGTSMGVPTIGCECAVCHSRDPRDRRTRPSIWVEYGGKSVLIDSTPDFREQAIREHIRNLDAVLYTHSHADHILGLDDLRPLSYRHQTPQVAATVCAARQRLISSVTRSATFSTRITKFGGLAQVRTQI